MSLARKQRSSGISALVPGLASLSGGLWIGSVPQIDLFLPESLLAVVFTTATETNRIHVSAVPVPQEGNEYAHCAEAPLSSCPLIFPDPEPGPQETTDLFSVISN